MNVQEFLNINRTDGIFKEVPLSERISDEEGKPYLFKIKPLTMEEFERAKARASKGGKGSLNGFKISVIISGSLYPSFKDAESLKAVGAATPEDYIKRVLLSGEISRLSAEILRLSGFGDTYGS